MSGANNSNTAQVAEAGDRTISTDLVGTNSLRTSVDKAMKGKPFFRKTFPGNANATTGDFKEKSKKQSVSTRFASALADLLSRKKSSPESSGDRGQNKDISPTSDCLQHTAKDNTKVQVAILFNSSERQLLRGTWSLLKHDIAEVGIETFMGLFNTHPDSLDAFLVFRDYNIHDLEQSAILRAHTLRVMQTVDKCISRLDEPDKMATVLTSLGCRHFGYQAERSLIPIIGKQFIAAIEPKMAEQWSTETRKAWEHLFEVINFHMDKGIASQVLKASRKEETFNFN